MTVQTISPSHHPSSAGAVQAELGALPEWNLSHLYPGMDSEAFKGDLARAEAECKAFAAAYRGKLDEMARDERASERLDEVVKRYEALEDLLGRLMSYAGLVYSGDTTDPIRAKFYGDTQERLTAASTELLFFGLELNRIEDAVLDKAMSTGPLAHYRPWIEDLRKDKPYQLDDKIEQLFHEKSVTGRSAWNRLFDETIASLRFTVRGEELAIEPTLNKLQDPDESVRKDASDALAKTFKANLRTFTLITNTLAKDKEISDRWRGFEDVADSRHLANRVEREVVEAHGLRRARGLSAPVAPLLRPEGEVVRQGQARPLGPQCAAAEGRAAHHSLERGQGHGALRLFRLLAAHGRHRAALLRRGLDRRARPGPARRPAPSPIRPCPRRILTCCSTTRASRGT